MSMTAPNERGRVPAAPEVQFQYKQQANFAVTASAAQVLVAEDAYTSRRRFLIWACMAGFVGPERVAERILAELGEEAS